MAVVPSIISQVRAAGQTIRVAASGHSFTHIAAGDQHMITLEALPTAVDLSDAPRTVTVSANTRIRSLNRRLAAADLALDNWATSITR
ncbi:MAG: FAD-binding protein [Euzebya sp.]